jgi:hypothetical protein
MTQFPAPDTVGTTGHELRCHVRDSGSHLIEAGSDTNAAAGASRRPGGRRWHRQPSSSARRTRGGIR